MSNQLDLTNCDAEPIHIPGSIQPYGGLFVTDAHGVVVQESQTIADMFGESLMGKAAPQLGETFEYGGKVWDVSSRPNHSGRIIELEPADHTPPQELFNRVHQIIATLSQSPSLIDLADEIVYEVRELLGFDRVMLYRFLVDDSGEVIAEARDKGLEAYLGLRYPSTDIPKQARALYVRNWTRLVADVEYVPSLIQPTLDPDGRPLDLSDCALRSVSPIHVQYLKNMGVRASMSISIVKNDRLWGLIACHHMTPWYGSKGLRAACEMIGRFASLQITALEVKREELERSRSTLRNLIKRLQEGSGIARALTEKPEDLLSLVGASGAAVIDPEGCRLIGATPSTNEVQRLARWVEERSWREPYATESLSKHHVEAARYAPLASGLLAICQTRNSSTFVLWFRPEMVETITWAGNPEKPSDGGNLGLKPRASFGAWQEDVRDTSAPWNEAAVAAASELRIAILESELTSLNADLERRVQERTAALQKAVDELNGFTYSVSHDLRTPLRGMVGNARILLEEYGEQVGRGARERLLSIETNALKMSNLVDDLLSFARYGRQEIKTQRVDISRLAQQVGERLHSLGWPSEGLNLQVDPELRADGDSALIEILLTILIENGCKFRPVDQTPMVHVGSKNGVFYVANRGIGFDMNYTGHLFQPFHRLHRDDDFPGTGIGLANAKRIVERHGGTIWAYGIPDRGATFYFTLSETKPEDLWGMLGKDDGTIP